MPGGGAAGAGGDPHPSPPGRGALRPCPCCVCADLEVLYWKQLKERLAAQRKLQSRAVSGAGAGGLGGGLGGALGSALLSQRPPWALPLEHEEEPEVLEEEREEDFGGDAEEAPGTGGAPGVLSSRGDWRTRGAEQGLPARR